METKVKEWLKPAPDRQVAGVAADLLRSKPELIAENAFLRQQVETAPAHVLKRSI